MSETVFTAEEVKSIESVEALLAELKVMTIPEEVTATREDYPNIGIILNVIKENVDSIYRLSKNMVGEIVERK